ncbi:MAG: PIN domain-containing protein [candidate division WOR-3 bacterium]|nr:PIN domain-containing protein [candidate division WOR-3 bacterium]
MTSEPSGNAPTEISPALPEAIYLDACALCQLPEPGGNAREFTAFSTLATQWRASIFAPEVAVCEWKQHRYEQLRESARRLTDAWRRLSRFTSLPLPPAKIDEGLANRVCQTLDEQLKTLGIKTIETPRSLNLAEIVDMAVRKIRPFEEKREKGFRDTLILMTLIGDMQARNARSALLVSGDRIFDHPDVADRLHKHGLVVVRANNCGDAETTMKDAGQYATLARRSDWSRRVAEFANSRLNDIWEHIRHTMTVPARSWYTTNLDEPTILSVFDARPLRVRGARHSLKPEASRAGYEPARIYLDVELDVLARYMTHAVILNRTEFSLSAEREFQATERRGYGRTEKEATLTRSVSVEVDIKEENGTFVDIAVRDESGSDGKSEQMQEKR